MKQLDVEAILRPLKPFQRRTVEHAFQRMFLAPDSTARFLVADEVGLGKTLVARGIIAKAIEYYWDDVDRIDIVYICSNQSIARANLPKLQVCGDQERSFALATRLTMLATELAPQDGQPGLAGSKVNFVSFTPGTSFNMGHSGGMAKERRLIFQLLDGLVHPRVGLMNLLQGAVTKTKRWRYLLDWYEFPVDRGIKRSFQKTFRADKILRKEIKQVINQWFWHKRKKYPLEARQARNRIIGRLRRMLAEACVQALEPDLIILDEFQRFKSLLETREEYQDPAAEIAQALFHAETPEGHPVRTLLLSATPYKLYTADAEIEHEDHYADFLATTRFLMGDDPSRVDDLKAQLARFGTALKRAARGRVGEVVAAKRAVEDTLRSVMARTERVAASEDRDAMVEEPKFPISLQGADIRQYIAADALFRAVGDSDPMAFWKSAPYLPHFMSGYRFNDRLKESLEISPERVIEVLDAHPEAFLTSKQIEGWSQIDPGNAKLRELVRDLLDAGIWKLLWVPPTIPYWPLDGAFRGHKGLTKTLLFSAWNVVPDVVSGVLSYEAERRMVGGSMQSYRDPNDQQSQLLDLGSARDSTRSRHRILLFLMPCLRLADEVHPLASNDPGVRRWVRDRVATLLSGLPDPREGPVDDRWEWMILYLIDPELKAFLEYWRDAEFDPDDPIRPDSAVFGDYVNDLLGVQPDQLGRRPDGLAELVTELALGAPGILAARTLAMAGIGEFERRRLAARLASSFWKLFNRPAVIKLIQQLADPDERIHGRPLPYWRQAMRYCIDGNLQAVLDEAWHLAWEQHAWSERETREAIAHRCIAEIGESVEPRPSRIHAHFYKANGSGGVDTEEIRLRTVVALRFGHSRTDEGALSQDAVRAAFNSPFRPFVLASTSIGQEGLDFHPWCHRLVHWNLPGNPVDLEQREGRVHRYKGHAVRKNVADRFGTQALKGWRLGEDLWSNIFELADRDARSRGESDLVPFWIMPGDWKVLRHVPVLPYTRELQAFNRLKRQLAAYRVVFGQPRQEELLTLLEHFDVDVAALKEWSIDLSPGREA